MKHFVITMLLLLGSAYTASAEPDTLVVQQIDLAIKADIDAQKHYKKYKTASGGTLIVSLASPILGLLPAIATSACRPQIANLNYPDKELFQQKEYYDSYTRRAKKIKQRKVWTNWAVAFGVNLLASAILVKSLDRNGYF